MAAVDREVLLKQISSEQVCGEDLEYDPDFIRLESIIKGKEEQQIGDTIIEAEEADWQKVKKLSSELLTRTKDIRIIIFLARALLNSGDLIGFKETLVVLKQLLINYWPDIYPLLDEDDGDPTMRLNALITLCDEEAVLLPLRKAPLVTSRVLGQFSLRDISYAAGEGTPPANYETPDPHTITGAFHGADIEELIATEDALRTSIDSVKELEAYVTEQVGIENTISFSPLTELLGEQQKTLLQRLEARGVNQNNNISGSDTETTDAELTKTESSSNGLVSSGIYPNRIMSRDDVLNALESIEKYYRQYEPASPIPLLINRAKKMVNMSFLEIIKNIAPDGLSQVEIIRGPEEEQKNDQQNSSSNDTSSNNSNSNDNW